LSQAGKATQEYGTRFEEDLSLSEDAGANIFVDAHAGIRNNLDDILSGAVIESTTKRLGESTNVFVDAHASKSTKLDDILSGKAAKRETVNESYRRTVSRGKTLVENDLFVDFD
jgi:hypothetical protein